MDGTGADQGHHGARTTPRGAARAIATVRQWRILPDPAAQRQAAARCRRKNRSSDWPYSRRSASSRPGPLGGELLRPVQVHDAQAAGQRWGPRTPRPEQRLLALEVERRVEEHRCPRTAGWFAGTSPPGSDAPGRCALCTKLMFFSIVGFFRGSFSTRSTRAGAAGGRLDPEDPRAAEQVEERAAPTGPQDRRTATAASGPSRAGCRPGGHRIVRPGRRPPVIRIVSLPPARVDRRHPRRGAGRQRPGR